MAAKMVAAALVAAAALVCCVAPLDLDSSPLEPPPRWPLSQSPQLEGEAAAAVGNKASPLRRAVVTTKRTTRSPTPTPTPSAMPTSGGAASPTPSAMPTSGGAASPTLASRPLLIGAFNVQIFGQKKASDPATMAVIARIAGRYDIMLLQEIRDLSATAAPALLNMINRPETPYGMVISARLGRTSSKEQYAFYYRSDRVQVHSTYQFPDDDDWFQREPFTVRFKVPDAAVEDFAIMAIHTEPTDAVNETSRLVDVYETVRRHMSLDDVMIAGDLNADCTYIYGSNWNKVRLWTDSRFTWLIGDCADTTATDTDCAYDRFVVAGSRLLQAVIPGTAQPHIYSSSALPAVNVSDHYPVEVALSGKPNAALQQQFSATLSLSVKSSRPSAATALAELRKTTAVQIGRAIGYQIWELSCNGNVTVYAKRSQTTDVIQAFEQFSLRFPGVVNDGMRAMLRGYFESNNATQRPFVHGLQPSQASTFDITISCAVTELMCAAVVDSTLR